MVVPVLLSVTPQVNPVVPQVIAPVLYYNNNSESNLYYYNMDLDKSSLLLSPKLKYTVVPCVVPCIRLSLLSPTTKIFTISYVELFASPAFNDLIASPNAYAKLFVSPAFNNMIASPAFDNPIA